MGNLWIQTLAGKFDYETMDDIQLVDIVNSLNKQCRFNGHCKEFYSVLTHSLYVHDCVYAKLLKEYDEWGYTVEQMISDNVDTLLWALLHDAHEAYITDLPSPFKAFLKSKGALEYLNEYASDLDKKIAKKFGVDLWNVNTAIIKEMDLFALYNEATLLFDHKLEWHWKTELDPNASYYVSDWNWDNDFLFLATNYMKIKTENIKNLEASY